MRPAPHRLIGTLVALLTGLVLATGPAQGADAPTGQIAGRVTDTSGAGIPGIQARVYDLTGASVASSRGTGADGRYLVGGLAPGDYHVGFQPNFTRVDYFDGFFDHQTSLATATVVHVAAGQTTENVDGTLTIAGGIRGAVTDAAGTPFPGVGITEYDAARRPLRDRATRSHSDGSFGILTLPTGTYFLGFDHPGYVTQYYPGQTSLRAAQPIQVTAPEQRVVLAVRMRRPPAPNRLGLASRTARVSAGRLTLRLRCHGTSTCHEFFAVLHSERSGGRRHQRLIAEGGARVKLGATKTVRLPLTIHGAQLMRRRHEVHAHVTFSGTRKSPITVVAR